MRILKPGYVIAFSAGSLFSHEIGWTRSAPVPHWVTVIGYAFTALVVILGVRALWAMHTLQRALKDERKTKGS